MQSESFKTQSPVGDCNFKTFYYISTDLPRLIIVSIFTFSPIHRLGIGHREPSHWSNGAVFPINCRPELLYFCIALWYFRTRTACLNTLGLPNYLSTRLRLTSHVSNAGLVQVFIPWGNYSSHPPLPPLYLESSASSSTWNLWDRNRRKFHYFCHRFLLSRHFISQLSSDLAFGTTTISTSNSLEFSTTQQQLQHNQNVLNKCFLFAVKTLNLC